MRRKDPLLKKLLRSIYKTSLGVSALINLLIPQRKALAVYFGGARSGHVGGPLVKVQRLREGFPESFWGYNLVYLLSSTPYLPHWVVRFLKYSQIPIVYNQNGVFYPAWYEGDWRSQNSVMSRAYHLADYVFYQSEYV